MNWITNGTVLTTLGTGVYKFKKANDKNIKITLECMDKIRNIPAVLNAIYCSERFEIELQAKYNAAEKAIDQLDHIFNYYGVDRFQKILGCFKNFLENTRPILRPHCKEKHRLIYKNICKYSLIKNTNASQHLQILTKIDEVQKEIERLSRPLMSGFEPQVSRQLLYDLIDKNKKISQQYFEEILDILNRGIESILKEITRYIETYKNDGFLKNLLFLAWYRGIFCFNKFWAFIKAKHCALG